jgi:hypothetical protein
MLKDDAHYLVQAPVDASIRGLCLALTGPTRSNIIVTPVERHNPRLSGPVRKEPYGHASWHHFRHPCGQS